MPRPRSAQAEIDTDRGTIGCPIIDKPVRERVHYDERHRGNDFSFEFGGADCTPYLRLVNNPLRIFTSDHLPIRRRRRLREEPDRFTRNRVESDAAVEV